MHTRRHPHLARRFGPLFAVLALVLLLPSPPASAAVTAINLTFCCPLDEVAAAGGLVILQSDGLSGQLLRIDPTSNRVTAQRDMPVPSNAEQYRDMSALAVAAGSVWFASYFENLVYRVDPVSLRIQQRIRTGRSPAGIAFDGTSLWTPLNHGGAVDRIDPRRNTVFQVVTVGHQRDLSDEPWKAAWDGRALLVSLPGSGRVAHVHPDGSPTTYDQVGSEAAMCASIVPVPDGYWLDDGDCGITYYHWRTSSRAITTSFSTTRAWGAVYVNQTLYTGGCATDDCTAGLIEKHDPLTGRTLAHRVVGTGEAWLPHAAFGSLWTANFDGSLLNRSSLF